MTCPPASLGTHFFFFFGIKVKEIITSQPFHHLINFLSVCFSPKFQSNLCSLKEWNEIVVCKLPNTPLNPCNIISPYFWSEVLKWNTIKVGCLVHIRRHKLSRGQSFTGNLQEMWCWLNKINLIKIPYKKILSHSPMPEPQSRAIRCWILLASTNRS